MRHDDVIDVHAYMECNYLSTGTGQAKEWPHLLVLAFPLYTLAA